MSIDEMVAGPDLDRLVAEEVMGHRVRFMQGAEFTADRDWLIDGWLDLETQCEVAKYSTDISAAWEVVERFRQHGGQPLVYWDADKQRWLAGMGDDFLSDAWSAGTAPLAICRAALKARRAEKELEADTPSNKVLHKTADKYLPTQDSCDEEWEGD